MKKFKKILSYALYLILAVVIFQSCGISEHKKNITKRKVRYNEKNISYPVQVQYVKMDKMNYAVFSSENSYGGVHVVNLTLDSLKKEYYKSILNDR